MKKKQLIVTDLISLAEHIHLYTKTNWEIYFTETLLSFKKTTLIPPPTNLFNLKEVKTDSLIVEDILKGAFPNRDTLKIIQDITPIILNCYQPERDNFYLVNSSINDKKNRSHRLQDKIDSLAKATDIFQDKLSQLTRDPEVSYFFSESGIATPEETANLWLSLQRFRVRISNGHRDTKSIKDTLKTPREKNRIEQTIFWLSNYFEDLYQGKTSKDHIAKNIKAQLSFKKWLVYDNRLFSKIDSSVKLQTKDKVLQPDDFIDHLVYQFTQFFKIGDGVTTNKISRIRKKIYPNIMPASSPTRSKQILIPELFGVISDREINNQLNISLKEIALRHPTVNKEINLHRANFYSRLKEKIESLPNCQPTSNFKGLKVTEDEITIPHLLDENSGKPKFISPSFETRALKYVEWKLETLKSLR